MMTFHLDIKPLSDDLKCPECKFVVKNAYHLSCGCRFCRFCIDDMIARGHFCVGSSHEYGATLLSTAVPDDRAHENILKLTAKCPHVDSKQEYSLVDVGGQLRVCPRETIDYPFSPFYSLQGSLAVEEVNNQLHKDSGSHSQILIGLLDVQRNMEMLKRDNEASKDEIQMLKLEMVQKDKQIKHIYNEIKSIKDENESIKVENKSIKDENDSLKNENKAINCENKSIREEIKSIKIENEFIQSEIEALSNRVRQLSEQLKREIDERCQSDECYIAKQNKVTGAVTSNREALNTFMEPTRDHIQSINRDIQLIKDQFDSMIYQLDLIQMALKLEHFDDWLIDVDLGKTQWLSYEKRTSGKFTGEKLPYTYELVSENSASGGELRIWLRIWASSSDSPLEWPFRNTVTITVAHRDMRKIINTDLVIHSYSIITRCGRPAWIWSAACACRVRFYRVRVSDDFSPRVTTSLTPLCVASLRLPF